MFAMVVFGGVGDRCPGGGQISGHVVVEAESRPAPRGRARACCLPLHLRGTAGRPGLAAVAQRDVACMINEITSSRCAQWVITTNLGYMPPSPDVCLPDITPTLTRLEILILTLNPKLCVFPVLPIRYIIITCIIIKTRTDCSDIVTKNATGAFYTVNSES